MTDLDPITAAELLDQLAGRLADLAASTSGPRVTLRPPEAAAALGGSDDYFREHVAPDLGVIRRGRLRLYRVAELERWAERAEDPAPLTRGRGL